MKYVFVDADHTLFHSAWRDHMSPVPGDLSGAGTTEDAWDAYTLAGSHDDPVPEVVQLVQDLYHMRYVMVVLTAVNERFRGLLNQRLLDAKIFHCFDQNTSILMRPVEFAGVPSAILKPGMIIDYMTKAGRLPVRDHVAFVLDDRADVAEAIKALGVTVLQVHAVERNDESKIFCKECRGRRWCRDNNSCLIRGGDL